MKTRPDTRLPQLHAGGQGPYLRSIDNLGRDSEDRKKRIKQCDGSTVGRPQRVQSLSEKRGNTFAYLLRELGSLYDQPRRALESRLYSQHRLKETVQKMT